MPSRTSIFKWFREHPDFADNYARAKEESADSMVEDMLAIADDDELDANDKRVRVDTRKWISSKLKPKKYGDKQQVEHTLPQCNLIQLEDKE